MLRKSGRRRSKAKESELVYSLLCPIDLDSSVFAGSPRFAHVGLVTALNGWYLAEPLVGQVV